MLRKNKKGWIRIVEAFIAILIITGVLLTVINKGYIGKKDISEEVYDSQIVILREIQLDDSYRNAILSVEQDDLPLEWDSFTEDLGGVKTKIEGRTPAYLTCTAKICKMNEICSYSGEDKGDVYALSVAISASSSQYNPKQLKLFCSEKD